MFCGIFTQSFDAFWGHSNILKINCKAVSTTASSITKAMTSLLLHKKFQIRLIVRSELFFHKKAGVYLIKLYTILQKLWQIFPIQLGVYAHVCSSWKPVSYQLD